MRDSEGYPSRMTKGSECGVDYTRSDAAKRDQRVILGKELGERGPTRQPRVIAPCNAHEGFVEQRLQIVNAAQHPAVCNDEIQLVRDEARVRFSIVRQDFQRSAW